MGTLADFKKDFHFLRSKGIVESLLQDRTTGKHIIMATSREGAKEITEEVAESVRLRYRKEESDRKERTRKNAEVATPLRVCGEMVGRLPPFEAEAEADFAIKSTCLEITCGEAPFLASRYDCCTGRVKLPALQRTGILDRKLEKANEAHGRTREEYGNWALLALKSVYGYEFQGDSLLAARVNVIMDFIEHWREAGWNSNGEDPEGEVLEEASEIISWNLWQMDGLTFLPPLKSPKPAQEALPGLGRVPAKAPSGYCKIMRWEEGSAIEFKSLVEGVRARS